MLTILTVVIIVCLIGLFIFPTVKRPTGCTCPTYDWLRMGPVDNCPVHKHMIE